jgi:hypothetical protein
MSHTAILADLARHEIKRRCLLEIFKTKTYLEKTKTIPN